MAKTNRLIIVGAYVRVRSNPQLHGFISKIGYGIACVLCDGVTYRVLQSELVRTYLRTPQAQDYDVPPDRR